MAEYFPHTTRDSEQGTADGRVLPTHNKGQRTGSAVWQSTSHTQQGTANRDGGMAEYFPKQQNKQTALDRGLSNYKSLLLNLGLDPKVWSFWAA